MVTITKKGGYSASEISELHCLSSDTKPTNNVPNGSIITEVDTGKVYAYDAENALWILKASNTSNNSSNSSSNSNEQQNTQNMIKISTTNTSQGRLEGSGSINSNNSDWNTSDLIKINNAESVIIKLNSEYATNSYWNTYELFDKSGTYIANTFGSFCLNQGSNEYTIGTINENAYYIKVCTPNPILDNTYVIVNYETNYSQNYSTNEVLIGKFLGENLYRKVVNLGVNSIGTSSVNTSVTRGSILNIINGTLVRYCTSATNLPQAQSCSIWIDSDDKLVVRSINSISNIDDAPIYCVIEYTKTTD